jgi:hypothetical protein
VDGWIDRVIGWVDNKLEELARYAADPTAGGGLQSADYFMLQLLNRHIPVLKHYRHSRYVHPERLYEILLQLAGELATFATAERRARSYPNYDHDNLELVFTPVVRDIQDFLSAQLGRRAIRLEIVERGAQRLRVDDPGPALFRNANLVLEVAARRPLTEIQGQFPHLFKIGPNTKMNEIVHAHLPGVNLIHLPTPPPQIRAITDHVYFYLDRTSPLWPEFSTASSIGMHFSGDWPELELELWAVLEGGDERRNPFDPFGGSRGERTSSARTPGTQVRGGPGGSAAPGSRLDAAPQRLRARRASSPAGASRRPSPRPTGPARPRRPSRPPPAPAAQPMLRRDAVQAPGDNPVLRAAAPLLLLLGRLRGRADGGSLRPAHGAGRRLHRRVRRRDAGGGDRLGARRGPPSTSCARTADDIVQNTRARTGTCGRSTAC